MLDGKRIDETVRGVFERAKQFEQGVRTGSPYARKRLRPEEEAFWFERQAARDPDWVRALPYAKGGKQQLQRYLRARGLR